MSLKNSLVLLRNILKNPLLNRYDAYLTERTKSAYADFLYELFRADAQDNFAKYVAGVVLCDENAFSLTCAKKKIPSPYVRRAYAKDLHTIYDAIYKNSREEDYCSGRAEAPFFNDWGDEETLSALSSFYASNGYGDYILYKAFRYEENGLLPISSVSDIRLTDLKDYKEEKKIIANNIESFLNDLPFSNMLLYGERGTGKSSTIHAMLNEYGEKGLRLVELSKENMLTLNVLKGQLSKIPLKFIVFIDDLSLSGGDERISSLKAALEGSMEGHASNAMIAATSNRRHIVNEKFSDREDSVHVGDSMQEELSLADRFGLSVLFTSTTKQQYLSIVEQLAEDFQLNMEKKELEALAERWALQKGGRSPRRAKQFIELVYSCLRKNIPVEF